MLKRVKFHKSLFWVPILAAGGPYWVPISQKNLSLGVPISFRDSAIAQASPKERKSFLAAFVNGILFIQYLITLPTFLPSGLQNNIWRMLWCNYWTVPHIMRLQSESRALREEALNSIMYKITPLIVGYLFCNIYQTTSTVWIHWVSLSNGCRGRGRGTWL